MRIAYGVCSEGYGHITRAKKIITNLKNQGHEILVLVHEDKYNLLKNFNILKVLGPKIAFKDGKVLYRKTITHNFIKIVKNVKNFKKWKEEFFKFNPQLCITDMEPITFIFHKFINCHL